MIEYPKIETLFNRDEKTSKVRVGDYRNSLFTLVKEWLVTEKIDGTNTRIELTENGEVIFGGRTEKAQIQVDLLNYLTKTFTPEKMKKLWLPDKDGNIKSYKITLFGEGYGKKIQKAGELYRGDVSFRLFDVLVMDRYWLDWDDVIYVAGKLEIKTVPYVNKMTTEEIVEFVKNGFMSIVAREDSNRNGINAEGVVAKSPFYDKRGKRIMFKLKTRDF